MYKLSEQSASRIIAEMPDFSFLNDTYVFTVKERFNISDDFYEVGDLVAISGANKTAISILPYDTLISLDYIAGLTDDRGGLHPNSDDEHNIMNEYTKLSERNKGKVEQLIADLLESQN